MYKTLTDAEIGQIIKKRRLAMGLTQTQLGEKLGVGAGAVNKWEQGVVTNIKREILRKIAIELGIHPSQLIGLAFDAMETDFDYSPDEMREIFNYIQYVKSKRKK